MQKRLTRKLDLEILLSQVKPHPTPLSEPRTVHNSSRRSRNDAVHSSLRKQRHNRQDSPGSWLRNRQTCIGSSVLGRKRSRRNRHRQNRREHSFAKRGSDRPRGKTRWITADIEAICGKFDTVLQNPPFGVQKRGADRRFLEKALAAANTVYSLHKSVNDSEALVKRLKASSDGVLQVSPSPFLQRFIEKTGDT